MLKSSDEGVNGSLNPIKPVGDTLALRITISDLDLRKSAFSKSWKIEV